MFGIEPLYVFFASLALFAILLLIPTTEQIEDRKDEEDSWKLFVRRQNMPCYGHHTWIVNRVGKRVCKKCEYEHPEERDETQG